MTEKADYKPLEWFEDEQRWSWPPKQSNGRSAYKEVVTQLEDAWWTLYHLGGVIDDKNASRILHDQLHTPNLDPVRMSQLRGRIQDLKHLGVVEVRKPSPEAKTLNRIALKHPDRLPPGTDPHADAKVDRLLTEPTVLRQVEPPPVSLVTPQTVAVALLEETFHLRTTLVERIAEYDEKLEEFELQGAPVAAERNHLADQLKKALHTKQVAERDLEVERGHVKTLRVQLSQARQELEQKDANLKAAVEAAQDLARRSGLVASQDTERALQQFISKPPNDYKER